MLIEMGTIYHLVIVLNAESAVDMFIKHELVSGPHLLPVHDSFDALDVLLPFRNISIISMLSLTVRLRIHDGE